MPRYDYQCDACKTVKERFVPIKAFDPDKTIACDECENGEMWYKPSYTSITGEPAGRWGKYDVAADRTFNSKEEYRDYMREYDLSETHDIVLV